MSILRVIDHHLEVLSSLVVIFVEVTLHDTRLDFSALTDSTEEVIVLSYGGLESC